jgi:type VI secretion system protein ImpH
MRSATNSLAQVQAFLRALEDRPYEHDFFQTLRRIECLFFSAPRIGQALRPADEGIRFSQEPSLDFAPATLSRLVREGAVPTRLEQRFFGLLGPNGPLPLHLTEYARDRILHGGDATFPRFLDIVHHRFVSLFYRAWAQAQFTVSLDRPKDDRVTVYVGSLLGIGASPMRGRDEVPDFAKLFYSGLLARHIRNRDGLTALLSGFFRIPVRLEEFVGHWMTLSSKDVTKLGSQSANAELGRGAVLGSRVWDRQHKFRIRLGAMTLSQYEAFLPGGDAIAKLVAWVRQYLSFELEWDARLVLAHDRVPQARLGNFVRLGWTTWLGKHKMRADAQDLVLDAERLIGADLAGFRVKIANVGTA